MQPEYYQSHYDHDHRWMSYWYQIKEVLAQQPRSVLEIGAGNKLVSSYLRDRGIAVTTLDIDPAVKADVTASVLEMPVADGSFDVVLCSQVLEHLPFEDFTRALDEIRRVTSRVAVISLPHWGWSFTATLKVPLLRQLSWLFKITGFKRHVFDGQHYWEIGKRGYPLRRIIKLIKSTGFTIKKHYIRPESPFHHFFILERSSKKAR